MVNCKIQIIEIIDDSFYPGICKAVLEDYTGKSHVFVDKLPMFGFERYEISSLPVEGAMRVELISDFGESVEIGTDIPDHIEAEDGSCKFIVSKKLIN